MNLSMDLQRFEAVLDEGFRLTLLRMRTAFGAVAAARKGRATHTVGVLASGTIQILGGPTERRPELFTPNREYPVLLRHANISGSGDDAALDGRGASLKINQVLDIPMNTGTEFFARDARAFEPFPAADLAKRSELIRAGQIKADAIRSAFRDPASFTEVFYYSQIAWNWVVADSIRLVRYRLIEEGRATEGGLMPPDFQPGPQTQLPRREGDERPRDFLSQEFKTRLASGPIRYRLQMQQREPSTEAMDASTAWDATLYPWQNLGRITLNAVVEDPVTLGQIDFNPARVTPGIGLPQTSDASHPASLGILRALVYAYARRVREEGTQYLYDDELPLLDADLPLPPAEMPSRHYQLLAAMTRRVTPDDPGPGVVGVYEGMAENVSSFMPCNLTRLDPRAKSPDVAVADSFFVERRLNGFHPGQIRTVDRKKWTHEIEFDLSCYEFKPKLKLPRKVFARFLLANNVFSTHSIEIDGTTTLPTEPEWAEARRAFRQVEFLIQELQLHLSRCHLNMEQYAMAFLRNVTARNPLWELLRPTFEGLIVINWRGSSRIVGPRGFVTVASALTLDGVQQAMKDELAKLHFSWDPCSQLPKETLPGDSYSTAVRAMWGVLNQFVDGEFKRLGKQLETPENWDQIKGMFEDLAKHTVFKPKPEEKKKDRKKESKKEKEESKENFEPTMENFRTLVVYVLYHSIFLHAWTNFKQYEDAGDVEFLTLGMLPPGPDGVPIALGQLYLTHFLSSVRYKPLLAFGPAKLRELVWECRDKLIAGIPLGDLMCSINI